MAQPLFTWVPAGAMIRGQWDDSEGEYVATDHPITSGPMIDINDIPGLPKEPKEVSPPANDEPEPGVANGFYYPPSLPPGDHVTITHGTGRFEGHNITLNAKELDAVREILAKAVVRQLDEERQRVLDALVPKSRRRRESPVPQMPRQRRRKSTEAAGGEETDDVLGMFPPIPEGWEMPPVPGNTPSGEAPPSGTRLGRADGDVPPEPGANLAVRDNGEEPVSTAEGGDEAVGG